MPRPMLVPAGVIVLTGSLMVTFIMAGNAASAMQPIEFGVLEFPNSLVHPVSRMPVEDDEGRPIPDTDLNSLTANKQQIGFSEEDAARAMATTGKISCVDRNGRELTFASGFLLRTNVLATAAHALIAPSGKPHLGVSVCLFKTFARGARWIRINLDARHAKFYTKHSDAKWQLDLVLVKLDGLATVLSTFPSASSDRDLAHGERIVALTAYQGEYKTAPGNQPFAQLCTHRNFHHVDGLTFGFNDCASEHGSSGGLLLARDAGRWIIRQMVVGGGPSSLDGHKYDIRSRSHPNYTAAITIDTKVVHDAVELGVGLRP